MAHNDGFESDIDPDDAQALSRDKGGVEQRCPGPEQHHRTTPSDEFVGRVAGDDGGGYEAETGAKARAAAGEN